MYLVGREAELVPWTDGSLVDRMHLSNLLVRSIWIKDAMVTRLEDNPFLSVFVLPDKFRMDRDPAFRGELAAGMSAEQAMRSRFVEAIGWAQGVSGISARLDTERIYLLCQAAGADADAQDSVRAGAGAAGPDAVGVIRCSRGDAAGATHASPRRLGRESHAENSDHSPYVTSRRFRT